MKQHKWHEEIKAWADGAEIENRFGNTWVECKAPQWGEQTDYRIKPQPKEPQYLYVWVPYDDSEPVEFTTTTPIGILDDGVYKYVGKIKLEVDVE